MGLPWTPGVGKIMVPDTVDRSTDPERRPRDAAQLAVWNQLTLSSH